MKKSRLITRLLACLLLFIVSGHGARAQAATVTMRFADASFVEVINEFRRQSGVRFMYNLETVKNKKANNLVVENVPVERAIGIVLGHFGLTYSSVEGVIVVREAERQAPAQPRIARGRVVDKKGVPLVGVSILVKGTNRGSTTDANGNFTVTLPSPEQNILVFTYLGMQPREVRFTDENAVTVTLEVDEMQLEDVQVVSTGYGSILRKDMVGSYTIIKAEDIMMPAYTSIDQMLQGVVPGMLVENTSSRVGRSPQITIRGTSTLLGNTDPLWVVDGIIQTDPLTIDASSSLTSDMKELIGNQISWLNPADIETITVLKDASATAIYGSKASNGVIVITTKRGEADRMSIRYSSNFSYRVRPNYDMFDFMTSKERIQFGKEAYDAGVRYQSVPLPQIYTYEGLIAMYNNRQITEEEFKHYMQWLETGNTDWLKILTRNSFSHSHNLSMSGGSEKVTYNASLGYSSNHGVEKGNDMTQFSARLGVNAQMAKNLRVSVNLHGTMADTDGYGPGINPMTYASSTSRAVPAYEENGDLAFYKEYYSYNYNYDNTEEGRPIGGYNIINEMAHSYSNNKSYNYGVSINLDWKITNWLSYQFVGGVANSLNRSEAYAGERTAYIARNFRGYDYGTEANGSEKFKAALLPFGGELSTSEHTTTSYNMQNKLVFSKSLEGGHRFNAMAAMEIRSADTRNNANNVWGYVPERGETLVLPAYPSNIEVIGGVMPEKFGVLDGLYNGKWQNMTLTNNYVSFFATLAYSYKDRYVFNGNVRSDASNRFGQDANKQFDPTFSFGVSWRVAEENFIKDNVTWINQLSLRATWGVQGNVVTSLSPELIARYGGILSGYNEYYSTISSIPNPHLKWERTHTWNLGLDMQLFRSITMGLEYYGRRSNAIIDQNIAQEYGMKNMKLNGGRISNHGVEFSMNFTPFRGKDFAWTVGFNASRNWNKSQADDKTAQIDQLTKNDFLSGGTDRLLKKGYPLSAFWSYDFAGLNPENGYPMFNRIDFETANVNIDPTTFLVYSGPRQATFTGGFNTRIHYKDFSVGANFSVLLGNKKRLPNPYSEFSSGKLPSPFKNLSKTLTERWQNPGDEEHTFYPALWTAVTGLNKNLPDGTIADQYSMWAQSNKMVVSGSFLRCTQISVSWNLPRELCAKIGLTSISINGHINNPFVIASKRFNGFDPELGNSIQPRIFSWGLSFGF